MISCISSKRRTAAQEGMIIGHITECSNNTRLKTPNTKKNKRTRHVKHNKNDGGDDDNEIEVVIQKPKRKKQQDECELEATTSSSSVQPSLSSHGQNSSSSPMDGGKKGKVFVSPSSMTVTKSSQSSFSNKEDDNEEEKRSKSFHSTSRTVTTNYSLPTHINVKRPGTTPTFEKKKTVSNFAATSTTTTTTTTRKTDAHTKASVITTTTTTAMKHDQNNEYSSLIEKVSAINSSSNKAKSFTDQIGKAHISNNDNLPNVERIKSLEQQQQQHDSLSKKEKKQDIIPPTLSLKDVISNLISQQNVKNHDGTMDNTNRIIDLSPSMSSNDQGSFLNKEDAVNMKRPISPQQKKTHRRDNEKNVNSVSSTIQKEPLDNGVSKPTTCVKAPVTNKDLHVNVATSTLQKAIVTNEDLHINVAASTLQNDEQDIDDLENGSTMDSISTHITKENAIVQIVHMEAMTSRDKENNVKTVEKANNDDNNITNTETTKTSFDEIKARRKDDSNTMQCPICLQNFNRLVSDTT